MKPKSTGLTDNTVEPNAVNSIARRPGSPGSFTDTGAVNGAYYQVNQASYEEPCSMGRSRAALVQMSAAGDD
jgi:hypothetical protein